MSKYHYITTYDQLQDALDSVRTKVRKQEKAVASSYKSVRPSAPSVGFASGVVGSVLGSGSNLVGNCLLVWRALKVARKVIFKK